MRPARAQNRFMSRKLLLRAEDALPWNAIAPDVYGDKIVMVNVFAVRASADRWTLIDAGLPYSAAKIVAWAEDLFGPGTKPESILLTHGHFDHVGALRTLVEHWDVPVYAHRLEMQYLDGTSEYPPPNPAADRGMMSWLSPLYPKGPIDLGPRLRS